MTENTKCEAPPAKVLTRRRVLVGGAAVAGTALAALPELGSAPAMAATPVTWQPKFLSPSQATLLSRLCDLLLPATSTPGAVEAGVPEYIDLAVSLAEPEAQLRFLGGLGWIDHRASSVHGSSYVDLDETRQIALLREISDEHASHPADLEPGAAFFSDLKRRTLFGYFTSQTGRVETLGQPAKVEHEVFQGCGHSGDDHSA